MMNNWPRTGKEWEEMEPDKRPRFWATPVTNGEVRYRVDQLIFKTNDDAVAYVKKEMPLSLGQAMAIWTAASNAALFNYGMVRGLMSKLKELPRHMEDGIMRYVEQGILPGHFLRALLSNDLYKAAMHADGYNAQYLANWARFVEGHLPIEARGSEKVMLAWSKRGGLYGQGLIEGAGDSAPRQEQTAESDSTTV